MRPRRFRCGTNGDPRFAFYMGAELTTITHANRGGTMAFVVGPRFGFRNGLFLAITPLGLGSICSGNDR